MHHSKLYIKFYVLLKSIQNQICTLSLPQNVRFDSKLLSILGNYVNQSTYPKTNHHHDCIHRDIKMIKK